MSEINRFIKTIFAEVFYVAVDLAANFTYKI
jgi:hypothetical protein